MSTEYAKINGVFKRHTEGPDKGRFRMGDWALPEFAMLQDVPWEWSEKIDGTNIRIIYDPHGTPEPLPLTEEEVRRGFPLAKMGPGLPALTIQGRTDRAQLHPDLIQAIQGMIDPELWAATFGDQVAVVYGEGYGAGIQAAGKLYRPDKSFIGFDVAVAPSWWNGLRVLPHAAADGIMRSLGLPVVQRYPRFITLRQAVDAFRDWTAPHFFPSEFDLEAFEGVIGRPAHGLRDQYGHRIQTKLKVVDFR